MVIDCVEFCKALGDDTRQQILQMLLQGELSVGEIVDAFDVSQPTISHHLNVLKQVDLVTSRKEGKQVYYAINHGNVVECCGILMSKFEVRSNWFSPRFSKPVPLTVSFIVSPRKTCCFRSEAMAVCGRVNFSGDT